MPLQAPANASFVWGDDLTGDTLSMNLSKPVTMISGILGRCFRSCRCAITNTSADAVPMNFPKQLVAGDLNLRP